MLPRENLKVKSSEMARNASKTAKSPAVMQILTYHIHLKQRAITRTVRFIKI